MTPTEHAALSAQQSAGVPPSSFLGIRIHTMPDQEEEGWMFSNSPEDQRALRAYLNGHINEQDLRALARSFVKLTTT